MSNQIEMSVGQMTVSVDTDAGAAYIRLNGGQIVKTVEVTPSILVDVDAAGAGVGVELLGLAYEWHDANRDQTDWEPPRCIHGHILLGCPHGDCPTQTAYLDQQKAAVDAYEAWQQEQARVLVRSILGLPL